MKETKKITVCAMLAAFSVVLLAIGALFNVLDLSMAVIASLPVLFAHLEFRKSYPWLLWAVTSLLSLLLVTLKVYLLSLPLSAISKIVLSPKGMVL